MTTTYDETQWGWEAPEPSAYNWSGFWMHLTCPAEEPGEQGVQEDHAYHGKTVKGTAIYAQDTVTLKCLDCGATTTFEDEEFMGFEGEDLPVEDDYYDPMWDIPAGTPDSWIPDNPNADGFRMSDFI